MPKTVASDSQVASAAPYCSPAKAEDEQRVEEDIHYQSRRYDAQISYGGIRDVQFQLEDVQDGAGKKEEQASPADGDEQGNRNVVRSKTACILFVACTDRTGPR